MMEREKVLCYAVGFGLIFPWAPGTAQVQPAQNESAAFEVVSVKDVGPRQIRKGNAEFWLLPNVGPHYSGQHMSCRLTLLAILEEAFSLEEDRVAGPVWLDDHLFQVDAIVSAGSDEQARREMLRNMLKERFDLKFHYESRSLPVAELVVGKRGFALHEVPKEGHFSRSGSSGSDHGSYRSTETTIKEFSEFLSGVIHRRVIDETGLKGLYNFDLTWNSDWDEGPPRVDRGVMSAVQRKFGLELRLSNLPSQVLVVDNIAKTATEN
jgi:uncharacterized protein (TIGR03435 family)